MDFDPKHIHLRGLDAVIRLYHIPSGILIEVPRLTSSQYYDRQIAFEMLEAALTHPKYSKDHPHD